MAEATESGIVVEVEYRNASYAGSPPTLLLETTIVVEKTDKIRETVTMHGQISLKKGDQVELVYRKSESFFGKAEKKLVGVKTKDFYLNTEEKKRPTITFRFGD